MKPYKPKDIESKWQSKWEADGIYHATEDPGKPKRYVLEYFPYPSGAAMHVGHVRNYTIGDAISRFNRMNGFNVLHPMGWDAFGLPAENYAIKTGTSPRKAVDENTSKFKKQLMQMGFGYDWTREIDSTDPNYYKWTQWFFLLLHKRGLAYQKESLQWWCPKDKTVLANEQVENGKCWRCDSVVEKKPLKQWFFKITEYADRLVEDLDDLNWTDAIKSMQKNWIGRSVGAEIDFKVDDSKETIKVFTTRPDTLFGATFMVLAPENPLVDKITTKDQSAKVAEYVKSAQAKSDIERQETDRDKTGVFTGAYAINPVNNEKIPVWIADYVLLGYGTGAIMAVPAHDERDYEFAQKFELPIIPVIAREYVDGVTPPIDGKEQQHRSAIQIIIKHPNDDRYLILKKLGWKTETYSYVNGGIEKNEKPIDAALRELKEETGFRNFNELTQVGTPYFVNLFHERKQHNLRAQMYTFALQLKDLEHSEVSAEEKETNELVWVTKDELLKKVHGDGAKQIFRDYLLGDNSLVFEGVMINSDKYNDISTDKVREKIVEDLAKQRVAVERVNYKIRDWLISRQRYWGAPIPIIHCPKDGAVPVPEKDLPVKLPELKKFEPTDDGRSPLANVPEFVNTTCPKCGGKAERETDTMDGFACSSWYFLRFADPHNNKEAFSKKQAEFWLPVDDYIGGAEHAVMHLLYARFWTKVMFDEGLINFEEPFRTLRNQGMILAPDGLKMSKSKGNTIEPDGLIQQGYGADSIRIMELFIGPYDQSANWSVEGMGGSFRFLQRVWTLTQEYIEANESKGNEDNKLISLTHQAIKKVSQDLHELGFNTSVAALMEFTNELYKIKAKEGYKSKDWKFAVESLLQLLGPFAPHITEELWQDLGHKDSIHVSKWPVHDDKYLVQDNVVIVVQVNGKVRANVEVASGSAQEVVEKAAKADENAAKYITSPKKVIYVKDKLINFVV